MQMLHACTFACKNHEGTSCCQFADISQHQISDAFMPGHAPSHYISGFRGVRAGIHSQAICESRYTCMGKRGFGASQDRLMREGDSRSVRACARRMLTISEARSSLQHFTTSTANTFAMRNASSTDDAATQMRPLSPTITSKEKISPRAPSASLPRRHSSLCACSVLK